ADELDVERQFETAMRSVPTILPFGCARRAVAGSTRPEETSTWKKVAPVRDGGLPPSMPKITEHLFPLPRFADAAAEVAQSCEIPDVDAVVRHDPSIAFIDRGNDHVIAESVAVAIARRAMDLPDDAVRSTPEALMIGPIRLPIDDRGSSLILYTGQGGDILQRRKAPDPAYYSAYDVMRSDLSARLRNRVVLVGISRYILGTDMKLTPFQWSGKVQTPGLVKIAMQADNILQNRRPPWRPGWAPLFGLVSAFLLGLAGTAIGARARTTVAVISAVAGIAAIPVAAGVVFAFNGAWLDSFFPTVAWLLALTAAAAVQFATLEKDQAFLREAFGKYLEPKMIEQILENPAALQLHGEERELTILFADLRGFTASSENMTPAEVTDMLNEHLTAMSEVILRHHGTLDKFVGDCVMAFWGAPLTDPEHARHACEAAIEMLETMDRQNATRLAEGRPPVDMGVGINSGKVTVGNMGSKHRFDYTVIGDAVNLASRLEGLTKSTESRVLVGARTEELARAAVEFVPQGSWQVKGKKDEVPVYGLRKTLRAAAPTASTTAPRATG
ncbi:MAG TPA: adenylate/guanylate cyclase domain-containing protein, partial [bacterium]|nr:adenylate/guanylate cyclase domain-containing protein [bacterium]